MNRGVVVVDYGMGNLHSVSQAARHAAAGSGFDVSVSARPDTRCWSCVPASAPTTAGSPTSAAYPGRTSPRTA